MLFRLLGWAMMLLPFVIILFAFFKLKKNNRNFDFARVKLAFEKLKKRWFVVVLLTIVFALVFSGISYMNTVVNPTLSIKFNYAEASKGLNPNGTRFNPSEIISDDILSEVISRGQYSVSVEDLAKTLTLSSEFDDQKLDTTDPESSLMSTEYTLTYKSSFETMMVNVKEMINILADVYYETYLTSYTENDDILDITFEDVDNTDYCNMADYLTIKADALSKFVQNYANENANFHLEGGENFWAISSKIETFKNVEIEKFDAFVTEKGLTKNKSSFQVTMEYRNRLLQKEYDSYMAQYSVNLEAVDNYDPQMATIVLVPSQDSQMEYYMGRTKIGPDDFTNTAVKALAIATSAQETIKTNDYYVSRVLESNAGQSDYEIADNMLAGIKEQLESFAQECRETSDAYISVKRKGYMQLFLNATKLLGRIDLKNGVIFTGCFFVAVIIFFIAAYISRITAKRGGNK